MIHHFVLDSYMDMILNIQFKAIVVELELLPNWIHKKDKNPKPNSIIPLSRSVIRSFVCYVFALKCRLRTTQMTKAKWHWDRDSAQTTDDCAKNQKRNGIVKQWQTNPTEREREREIRVYLPASVYRPVNRFVNMLLLFHLAVCAF